ncbi:hypothetical protein DUI87_23911 [Hirundo rustica rustica]|uniref:Uncharacterized protein n=1 Tax=Hirundo rustica rustica TaxID=333673 RepID=A0A3M0JEQ2_HIRRU|nr:hypothetical protein DUI87_23911 [Hirundo rustica rustica]
MRRDRREERCAEPEALRANQSLQGRHRSTCKGKDCSMSTEAPWQYSNPSSSSIDQSSHHATDATRSKRIAPIPQRNRIGNLNCPEILEVIANWPENQNFNLTDEEEQEQVTRAEEAQPYNQLPAKETHYALFTKSSCRIIRLNQK